MRLKLGLLIFGVLLLFALLINFYVIGNLEQDSISKLEHSLIHSYRVYNKAQVVTRVERQEIVSKFAEENDIVSALMMPSTTPEEIEERHFKLFEKLEVISRLRYYGDLFIVLDTEGVEQARTQVAGQKNNSFGDDKAVKAALKGETVEDIWLLDGKIMIVDLCPIRSGGQVIGALLMANTVDDDLVKQEQSVVFGDFAFFSQSRVIASTLTSGKQAALNSYVMSNGGRIARVLLSKNEYFEDRVQLGDETYVLVLSPMTSMQEQGLLGFTILRSETAWLDEFVGSRNFLMLFSLLLMLLCVSGAFLIIQRAYEAIDFILEGAHQIIVGNKDYQWASDDDYLNQLGQTLNLAIAILLGKYIPEDEEEAASLTLRGSLDSGKAKGIRDRMIIESVEDEASFEVTPPAETGDAYFDKLLADFIAAKQDAGEDVSQITKERFIAKLQRTEQRLINKHNCKRVYFSVRIANGKVTLKPTPEWD